MYLTIGNISKSVRSRPSQRAWLLVGFIPVPELNWITNQEEKRIAKWELYHTCMSKLMDPVKEAAMRGVEMVCADGGVRRVHPILAAHIADFPEQQTVASTIRTHCPICLVPPNQRGDNDDPAHLRTNHEYKKAYELEDRGYAAMREKLGLRPVRPFWLDLPFANASQFIVPDLLHQMHRGVFGQHVVDWCTKSLGKEEMDRRYTGVPPLSGLRHFDDGISILSMETGAEARAIERTFIPVMAGSQPAEVVGAARCIMDFLYRAHRPQLNENDLVALEMDLSEFHDYKPIFESEGLLNTRAMFNGIPKLHMLRHYTSSIRQMGTTDGYNTETPERLHIDYVKVGYRASKGPDQIPQMARHLQRREALAIVRARLERHGVIPKRQVIWQRDGTFEEFSNDAEDLDGEEDELDGEEDMCPEANEDVVDSADVDAVIGVYRRLLLAKRPPRAVHGLNVMSEFHAPDFIKALRTFLDTYCPHAEFIDFDEHTAFEVWTRLRLIHDELPFAPLVGPKIDRVRAYPGPPNGSRRSVHTRAFDTVLLDAFPDKPGIHREFFQSSFPFRLR